MFYSASTGGFYLRDIHGSAIPGDAVEITDAEHAALLDGEAVGKHIAADSTGRPVLSDPPPPTPEQVQAQFTQAIQQRLDAFAQTRGYDGILSACTYAASTVAKFQAEGQYCVNSRDATWAKAYEILADVQAGTRPMPSSIAGIEGELPALAWPQ